MEVDDQGSSGGIGKADVSSITKAKDRGNEEGGGIVWKIGREAKNDTTINFLPTAQNWRLLL